MQSGDDYSHFIVVQQSDEAREDNGTGNFLSSFVGFKSDSKYVT
jgi:hypothetical protein